MGWRDDIIAQESGKAQLKVTAVDGETIDFMAMDLDFIEEETDNSSVYCSRGIASFLLVALLLAWLVIRRRKRLADLDLIDSWGVFGGETKEYDPRIRTQDVTASELARSSTIIVD